MRLELTIWRQKNRETKGRFDSYHLDEVRADMSFLEMLDLLNEQLEENDGDPVAFEHDCREGICGSCGFMINGHAHGPGRGTTVCQVHMRSFQDGARLTLEPWRARAFPVVQDLIVDRSAFDRVVQAGGFISVGTGSAPDANAIPIPKAVAESALDAAACIGCGACVAACKNASAMLFTGAKISHLGLLPQGRAERQRRVVQMVKQMDLEQFGNCTNERECEGECPKEISFATIARMNREFVKATLKAPTQEE